MITALIIDDELHARSIIKKYLEDYRQIEITGEANNGADAVVIISSHLPDLIFLDIQMPELNGFEVLSKLTGLKKVPVIIFTTAYDKYAIKAFEVNATDYLLKPLKRERFNEAILKAERVLKNDESALYNMEKLLNHLEAHPRNSASKHITRILIKETKRAFFVKTEDIAWIEASNYYTRVHLRSGKSHLLNESMGTLEKKLDDKQFIRIHRSSIVNIDYIKELLPHFNGEYYVMLADNTRLKLSRNYKDNLNALLS